MNTNTEKLRSLYQNLLASYQDIPPVSRMGSYAHHLLNMISLTLKELQRSEEMDAEKSDARMYQ